MADPVAAFQGWNSSLQGWNTGTWNTNVAYTVTATGSVGSSTVSGEANISVTGVAGTSAVGAVTVTGEANVTVTGVSATSALGSFFTTNTMVTMTASVNAATAETTGNANVTVTGVSATGEIGELQQPWGLIIPSQTPNFSGVTPSQTPSWADIAAQDKNMASTFVNDLRLEEIGSGEQSGSWGDTTNTNLELIAEAFSFGTEAITTNADTHTTTIADGATDPGRSMFLKYTGTLDSACTITIAPNTVSKLWFIENGTSGSQNILISQGSGANVTIPAGQTKAIYSNGGGSGAAMVDAFATLNVVDLLVDDDLTVTDDLIVGGDIDLEGSIDVNGTANLDATNIVGDLSVTGNGTFISTDTSDQFIIQNNDAGTGSAPDLVLWRNSSTPANSDVIGRVDFRGEDDNSTARNFATLFSTITDVQTGSPAGSLSFQTRNGTNETSRLVIDGSGNTNVIGSLDVSVNAVIDGTALVTGVLTTTAKAVSNGGIGMPDNAKLTFGGTGTGDLQIYHDGSNSFVDEVGDGALFIKGSQVNIQGDNDDTCATFIKNGASTLHFDNAAKIATASGGVTVTGNIANASGNFTISGAAAVVLDAATAVNIDAGSGSIVLLDDGTHLGTIKLSSSAVTFDSQVSNQDIIITGNDGGAAVTAVTFDMSDAGSATFNNAVIMGDNKRLILGAGADLDIFSDGANAFINVLNGLLLVGQASYSGNAGGQFHFAKDTAGGAGYGSTGATTLAISNTVNSDVDAKARLEFGQYVRNGGFIESGRDNGSNWGTTSLCDTYMVFATSIDNTNTEAMRITSAQDLLVGHTVRDGPVDNGGTAGVTLMGDGVILVGRAGTAMYVNREDSDGSIIDFRKDGGLVGTIGIADTGFYINGSSTTSGLEFATNTLVPSKNRVRIDNAIQLGASGLRFDDAHITNGVTTGSDRTEKQDIAALTSTEMLVAARISKTFHTYRWKDAVVDKGDNARIHTGTIAQEVQAAFTAEGLDVGRYAMFMSDTWWWHDVDVAAVEANEEEKTEAVDAYTRNDHYYTEDEAPEGSTKKTRLGIRYPELLSFLAAYNEQRFAAIETRLTALEG